MSKGYKVIKHNADHLPIRKTQCGSTAKTADKAADLLQRMRSQQAPGGSNWYSIERA
jgi:hypothetical protein